MNKGLGIIFHSGTFSRLHYGLSIALAALALGREVKLFFSFWALEYLDKKKKEEIGGQLDLEETSRQVLKRNIEAGHIQSISELLTQVKTMGGQIYACTNSMGILNITRGELVEEVDKSMGLTTFLTETKDYQILFI